MKRLPDAEIERIAAAYVRDMICRYSERNLKRLAVRIRKLAKQQGVIQSVLNKRFVAWRLAGNLEIMWRERPGHGFRLSG